MSRSAFTAITKKLTSFTQTQLARYVGLLVNIDDVLARISEKPFHLGIEVTNICNAKCVFCGYQYLERSKTILPMDLFKKGIDEFDAFGGGSVGFNPVVGDPLIDPNIVERIQYVKSRKNIHRVGLFTNGILINRVGAKDIISSGVDDVTISIGGFDRETYTRIFRVDRWGSVYEGILNLLKENEACDNKVNVCIALRSNVSIFKSLRTPGYRSLKGYKFDLQFNLLHFDNWSGRIRQEHLTGTMRLKNPPKKREPCSILYRVPKILSNGDVTICGCRDLDGDSELVLGNIKDKSILEMWRDPRVEIIRKGFYSSKYPEICRDCSMYDDLSFFRQEKVKALLRRRKPIALKRIDRWRK